MKEWEKTANRFVCFIDILGFKNLVLTEEHEEVLLKLEILKRAIEATEFAHEIDSLKEHKLDADQTRSFTFSDSIIIFSKSDTPNDALKIALDGAYIYRKALEHGLAIKGAFSFGKITVDFNKSLFFGDPIISAYLLHEELEMLTLICDHKFQTKFHSLSDKVDFANGYFVDYKSNLKCGKIIHSIMRPINGREHEYIELLKKQYNSTSGRPRIYLDNTLDFYSTLE